MTSFSATISHDDVVAAENRRARRADDVSSYAAGQQQQQQQQQQLINNSPSSSSSSSASSDLYKNHKQQLLRNNPPHAAAQQQLGAADNNRRPNLPSPSSCANSQQQQQINYNNFRQRALSRRNSANNTISHLTLSQATYIGQNAPKSAALLLSSSPQQQTSTSLAHSTASSNNVGCASPTTTTTAAGGGGEKTRYKTEMCRSFQEHGTCRYGNKCQFAHGGDELRVVVRHPKYKTEMCRAYHTTGFCSYGKRCHFVHEQEEVRHEDADQPAATLDNKPVQTDTNGFDSPSQQNGAHDPAASISSSCSESSDITKLVNDYARVLADSASAQQQQVAACCYTNPTSILRPVAFPFPPNGHATFEPSSRAAAMISPSPTPSESSSGEINNNNNNKNSLNGWQNSNCAVQDASTRSVFDEFGATSHRHMLQRPSSLFDGDYVRQRQDSINNKSAFFQSNGRENNNNVNLFHQPQNCSMQSSLVDNGPDLSFNPAESLQTSSNYTDENKLMPSSNDQRQQNWNSVTAPSLPTSVSTTTLLQYNQINGSNMSLGHRAVQQQPFFARENHHQQQQHLFQRSMSSADTHHPHHSANSNQFNNNANNNNYYFHDNSNNIYHHQSIGGAVTPTISAYTNGTTMRHSNTINDFGTWTNSNLNGGGLSPQTRRRFASTDHASLSSSSPPAQLMSTMTLNHHAQPMTNSNDVFTNSSLRPTQQNGNVAFFSDIFSTAAQGGEAWSTPNQLGDGLASPPRFSRQQSQHVEGDTWYSSNVTPDSAANAASAQRNNNNNNIPGASPPAWLNNVVGQLLQDFNER